MIEYTIIPSSICTNGEESKHQTLRVTVKHFLINEAQAEAPRSNGIYAKEIGRAISGYSIDIEIGREGWHEIKDEITRAAEQRKAYDQFDLKTSLRRTVNAKIIAKKLKRLEDHINEIYRALRNNPYNRLLLEKVENDFSQEVDPAQVIRALPSLPP